MILTENERYWWDLRLTSVMNKYFHITYNACLNRIEYHNREYYKNPYYYKFQWENFDGGLRLIVNDKLVAEMFKKELIEEPEKVWRFYKES